jgi:hypothetical protein
MKKLLIAVTLATLAASTAFAKTPHASPATPAVDPYVVISYGQVVGRDPDPNIRLEMLRTGALLAD